jgi:hypothetical protein
MVLTMTPVRNHFINIIFFASNRFIFPTPSQYRPLLQQLSQVVHIVPFQELGISWRKKSMASNGIVNSLLKELSVFSNGAG